MTSFMNAPRGKNYLPVITAGAVCFVTETRFEPQNTTPLPISLGIIIDAEVVSQLPGEVP